MISNVFSQILALPAQKSHLRSIVLLPQKALPSPLNLVLNAMGRIQRVRRALKSPVNYVSVGFIELSARDQELLNQFVEDVFVRKVSKRAVHHEEIVTRKAPLR